MSHAMAARLLAYRVFADGDGRMNLDVRTAGGGVLVVSQFTLYADARKGRRPSFVRAAAPEIKLVKYIGPQVWATRPGRAKTLAAAVDHLICIHDFEVPFYEPYGLACTVCGHPALGRYTPGDGPALRARQGYTAKEKIILVLPGSRSAPGGADQAVDAVGASVGDHLRARAAGPLGQRPDARGRRVGVDIG